MRRDNPTGNRVAQELEEIKELPIEQLLRRYPEPSQRAIRRISETEECTLEQARRRFHRRGPGRS